MNCIIALDLGTTAFKCAPVNESGLLAEPVTVNYSLDYDGGLVTCAPETYERATFEALEGACRHARAAGLTVEAIGILSQAQTYIPLDAHGRPMQKAIVWTDGRAVEESAEVARAIPDFARHSGFRQPLPELFMPKIRLFAKQGNIPFERVWKFPLLNEYIVYTLTGSVYGDTNIQGMSGFYHITRREWSREALSLAGITPAQLAETAPAACIGRPLQAEVATRLGIERVPVYACGNDQSVAAAGAGLETAGDTLCNFGTAMVVYAMKDEFPPELLDKQIAGINPLTGRYFLLGLESECGNVLDWAHRVFYAGRPFADMMSEALEMKVEPRSLPLARLPGGGRVEFSGLTVGHEGRHIVRALLELYADTFGLLLAGIVGKDSQSAGSYVAAGGLSRSSAWLAFLGRKFGITFKHMPTEQPGLVGVARIIRRAQNVRPEGWRT